MKILVIGGGGREHALSLKLSQSPHTKELYVLPGNGGTAAFATNVAMSVMDIDNIVKFAKEKQIDLTVVGPEAPLAEGIVDKFQNENLRVVGPHLKAAQLESSKDFSKQFMERHNIPTAKHITITNYDDGVKALESFTYPVVLKADGLCAGKGVVIAQNEKEAHDTLNDFLHDQVFGDQGLRVVIETFLDGFEVSQICLVQRNKIIPLQTSQDYKRIGEGNTGENTGGVGCLSPSPLIDTNLFTPIYEQIEKGLKEDDLEFYGILFIGFMVMDNIPYVLEFNTRFGDPETQVLMPLLKNDLVTVFNDLLNDQDINLEWEDKQALAVVLTSKGYPQAFEKGFPITIDTDAFVYHNGTDIVDNTLVTSGGRVLTVVTKGNDFKEMNQELLEIIEDINFEGKTYRKDIGLEV